MPRPRPQLPEKWTMHVQGESVLVGVNETPGAAAPLVTLTAREAVRMAQMLLACADAAFREEDARATLAANLAPAVNAAYVPPARGRRRRDGTVVLPDGSRLRPTEPPTGEVP